VALDELGEEALALGRAHRVAATDGVTEAENDVVDAVAGTCGGPSVLGALSPEDAQLLRLLCGDKGGFPEARDRVVGKELRIEDVSFALGRTCEQRIDYGGNAAEHLEHREVVGASGFDAVTEVGAVSQAGQRLEGPVEGGNQPWPVGAEGLFGAANGGCAAIEYTHLDELGVRVDAHPVRMEDEVLRVF